MLQGDGMAALDLEGRLGSYALPFIKMYAERPIKSRGGRVSRHKRKRTDNRRPPLANANHKDMHVSLKETWLDGSETVRQPAFGRLKYCVHRQGWR